MSVLNTFARKFNPRRNFDPSKIEDLRELKYFKENLTWKSGCPFYLEDPHHQIRNNNILFHMNHSESCGVSFMR